MRLILLIPTLLATLLLAVACAVREPVETQDIVSTIPWPDQEQAQYVLLQDGEEVGRGTLSVTRQDGRFELQLRFEGQGDRDEAVVLVDASTLKPVSVRREVTAQERTTIGEYDDQERIVTITEIDEEGDERDVPLRLEENYYDNESSLFLWRTIAFEEGYEANYHTVLANQRRQALVTVRVTGKEEVTVPAGTFQAWRVELRSQGRNQVAWFADTAERPLVQYDNSISLFQLVERQQSP